MEEEPRLTEDRLSAPVDQINECARDERHDQVSGRCLGCRLNLFGKRIRDPHELIRVVCRALDQLIEPPLGYAVTKDYACLSQRG